MKKLFILFVFVSLFSCSLNEEEACDRSPSFGAISSFDISNTSFRVSGSINISDCDKDLRLFGIVYSTSELPTISDQKKYFSENDFSVDVENLVPATTYYARAFLNKLERKFYSDQIFITTIQ